MRPPKNLLYYGTESAPQKTRTFRSGPLSAVFAEGDLRYVRLGDREVLRRVYFAARDPDWRTAMPRISGLRCTTGPSSFRITFQAENRREAIALRWRGLIEGSADTIRYTVEGEAERDFATNRVGLCVLHPVRECAGRPVRITRTDGSVERRRFPFLIAPYQPFTDVRAISHQVSPGVWAHVRLEGDVFETEDQRNFGDASYKTYSRPFALPRPFSMRRGETVVQSVTLSIAGQSPRRKRPSPSGTVRLRMDDRVAGLFPGIGLCAARGRPVLTTREEELLKRIPLSHLRVELDPRAPQWRRVLSRAGREAESLGTSLEVALFLSRDSRHELEALGAELRKTGARVAAWTLFDRDAVSTPAGLVPGARRVLSGLGRDASFGGGTDDNFIKIGRYPPRADPLDFITFSINPQVHSTDDLSVIENLEAQYWEVASARALFPGVPVRVGPVGLGPHFRSYHAGERTPGQSLSGPDRRQTSLLGACWTIGSVKYLAEAGASWVTYYETIGRRGVMEPERAAPAPGSSWPEPGDVYPVYHALADAAELSGRSVLRTISSEPTAVGALAVRGDDGTTLLAANLSGEARRISIPNLGKERVTIRRLNERTCAAAASEVEAFREETTVERLRLREPFELLMLPFEVARLDC